MSTKPKSKDFIKIFMQGINESLKNIVWILFLSVVATVFYAWHSAQASQQSSQGTLVLRYEQAYEGLNPNGTRFNINELLSKDVLSQAIDLAGLTGIVSVDELLENISVNASGSQDPKNMYIATEYIVKMDGNFLPRNINARNMLRLLLETYTQYFMTNYGSNDSALDIDWSNVEDWEYLEFADIMGVKVNNLITYLDNLRSESGMYQYHSTGESFKSLSESITNFRDIYLNKYTSYVTNNHLFRDPNAYRSKLTYRRFLTNQSLVANQEKYAIYQDALKLYDETMITFMMVPMYDSQNGLYMARTSIGMDSLTLNAENYAQKIEVDAKEILRFDSVIANTESPETNPEKYRYADEMIQEIEDHLNSLILRIQAVKKQYEEYRFKSSIIYSLRGYSIVSGYNLKNSVIVGAGTGVLCCLYYITKAFSQEGKS